MRNANETSNPLTTYELVQSASLAVRIYFDDLSYTLVSESPKTELVDMIANVGGLLGLFMGMSLLSFVEVIELFCEFGFIFWRYFYNGHGRKINVEC